MLHKPSAKKGPDEEVTQEQGASASGSGAPISAEGASGPGVAPTGGLAGSTNSSEDPRALVDVRGSGAEKTSAVVNGSAVAQVTKDGGGGKNVEILAKAGGLYTSIVKEDAAGRNVTSSATPGNDKKKGKRKSMVLTGASVSAPSQHPVDTIGLDIAHPAPSRTSKTKATRNPPRSVTKARLSTGRIPKKPPEESNTLGNPSCLIAVANISDQEAPKSVAVSPPEKATIDPTVLANSGSGMLISHEKASGSIVKTKESLPAATALEDAVTRSGIAIITSEDVASLGTLHPHIIGSGRARSGAANPDAGNAPSNTEACSPFSIDTATIVCSESMGNPMAPLSLASPESVISPNDDTCPLPVGSPMAEISALLRTGTDSVVVSIQGVVDDRTSTAEPATTTSPTQPSTAGRRSSRHSRHSHLMKFGLSGRRLTAQEAAEKLQEMFQVTPNVHDTGSRRHQKRTATIILVFLFASAALLLYLLAMHKGGDVRISERFCTSRGCLRHAGIMGLSTSANKESPCEHFGRFICSTWRTRHERDNVRRRFTQSVTEDAIMDHIVSVEKFVSPFSLPITERPVHLMDRCLKNRPPDDKKGLKTLLNFMHDSGFGFPSTDFERSDYSRPLRAMMDLASKWTLPLWFYVDLVLPKDESSNRTITLSHSVLAYFWDKLQDTLMVYEEVYLIYAHTITSIIYKGSIEKHFQDFIQGSKFMQKYIFGNLSSAVRKTLPSPIWIKIKQLPHFVNNTSVEHWLEALRPLWITDPPITEEDTVYVQDRDLLIAMNTLFTAYTAEDVYLHINWWFVQSIGAITSNALFENIRKDPERGPFFQKIICAIQVILNYNIILASENRASLSASERAAVMAPIINVHTVAVSKVSSAMSAKLALLLEDMQPVIWPADPYAGEEQLRRLYGNQTSNMTISNFFELWLSRANGYQQSRALLDLRSTEATIFREDRSAISSHHVISGAVSLSLAVLKSPFYYPSVTSAIIYGGIGFAYAAELVRALNSISVLLDGHDIIAPSGTNFSHSFIWVPYSCPGMNATDVFPKYVALELAYSTYLKFRRDEEDVRLVNAKHYSPAQIFFATVCYVMCDMASGADECDASMRLFPAFGDAFSCPLRNEKCAILS